MNIMLIGSMKFAKDMVNIQKDLVLLGHKVDLPIGTEPHLTDETFTDSLQENFEWCIKHDIMRRNFQEVARHDAVLVVNQKKNNIDGYIGVSALMEMAIAHYLSKKIFLLHPTPSFETHRWAHEVAIMQPVVLDNDLKKVQ
jgi:hypothetical protein